MNCIFRPPTWCFVPVTVGSATPGTTTGVLPGRPRTTMRGRRGRLSASREEEGAAMRRDASAARPSGRRCHAFAGHYAAHYVRDERGR